MRAARMMPTIEKAELVEHLAGPRPNPEDGITVLGPIPGWEGLFTAVTLPGIICSAYLGKIITDLVFQRTLPTNIDRFKPERFTKPIETQYGYHRLVSDRSI
jgi:glycine/D-amino acid oxidase-like deaminating enzyme